MSTATKARPYVSGFCGVGNHGLCRGGHSANPSHTHVDCSCSCHQQPAETVDAVAEAPASPTPAAREVDEPLTIGPGIHDLTFEQYLATPAISSSGLRAMLPPSCPASYRYGERRETPSMTAGTLAHAEVLGADSRIVVSPFDSYRTDKAKEWKAEQERAGKIIVTAEMVAKAKAMAAAVKAHPIAGRLFTDGLPERSLFWVDHETGVLCRIRPDWLRNVVPGRRLILVDYKTAKSADHVKWAKSAADYGYHQQAAFYRDGAIALGLDPDPAFVFVVQESDTPHVVNVIELDEDDLELGRRLNRRAIRLYADCLAADRWPGHSDGVETAQLPAYYRFATDEWLDAVETADAASPSTREQVA